MGVEREYVGPVEAARVLGVHPKTVKRMAARGEFPGALPPRREWAIPRDTLELVSVRGRGERGKSRGGLSTDLSTS